MSDYTEHLISMAGGDGGALDLDAIQAESTASLFWAKVSKTKTCWLWQATHSEDGYGRFWNGATKRFINAHRWAFEQARGPIPGGKVLDHLCRVRDCVNPLHLEVVTTKENTLRGIGPTALNSRKTHCGKGHEFTSENTYTTEEGRRCKECRRQAFARWASRNRGTK